MSLASRVPRVMPRVLFRLREGGFVFGTMTSLACNQNAGHVGLPLFHQDRYSPCTMRRPFGTVTITLSISTTCLSGPSAFPCLSEFTNSTTISSVGAND